MLTGEQITSYQENGFLVVEDILPQADIACARQVVEAFVERSRAVTRHDAIYDLEPGHTADMPRVRRLKDPCALDPIFRQIGFAEAVLDCVEDLIGPGVRYQAGKLNLKSAAFGSPVEWHQDFAFYPHTNDDLLAVGIALDDCTLENGCMLMIPGSHRGKVLDHHQEGLFVGAVDVARQGMDTTRAVPVPVRAGGITLHHCRMLHASAPNTSQQPRRLFFLQFAAVDAWPMTELPDINAFDAAILRGSPTRAFRVKEMDIRVPFPVPEYQGTIYELQERFRSKSFTER
jgi:phytanoyl-CoA hydroxylase